MSDTTDMIMEGLMCQVCGCFMDDIEEPGFKAPGYPRTCDDCKEDEENADT